MNNIDKESGRYYLSWLIKGVSVKELEVTTRIGDLDKFEDAESLRMIERLIKDTKLSPPSQRWLFKCAVAQKKYKVIKLYIRQGFDTSNEIEFDFYETNHDVRPMILMCQTPPLISAMQVETYEFKTIKFLVDQGCRLDSYGVFYFGGQNYFQTNTVGAAVYFKRPEVLKYLLEKLSESGQLKSQLNFKTIKKEWIFGNDAHLLPYFFDGFTPLMMLFFDVFHQMPSLSVIAPKTRLQMCKLLIEYGADQSPTTLLGDTVLHLAASKCKDKEVNEFLFKNCNIDLDTRNNLGMTPLDICKKLDK